MRIKDIHGTVTASLLRALTASGGASEVHFQTVDGQMLSLVQVQESQRSKTDKDGTEKPDEPPVLTLFFAHVGEKPEAKQSSPHSEQKTKTAGKIFPESKHV